MKSRSAATHLGAISFAGLLVFGLRIQDRDVGSTVGVTNARALRVYTPIFPGLANIEEHEIFAPRYAHTKKIVLLGGSPVDSVGCDSTWTKRGRFEEPNATYACSIAAQMNGYLEASGATGWRVFNLARNGAGLTPMLYVYSRIVALSPEIVIYGDNFPYLLLDNADADDLSVEQYEDLDSQLGADKGTRTVWRAYYEHLVAQGMQPQSRPVSWADRPRRIANALAFGDESVESARRPTIGNLLVALFTQARDNSRVEAPLRPIRFSKFRDWNHSASAGGSHGFEGTIDRGDSDPGFAYSQGLTLIAKLQEDRGGRFFFCAFPDYDRRADAQAAAAVAVLGAYLQEHGALFRSHAALLLRPIYETYDGVHQTLFGNRVIAAALLADLKASGLLQ